MSGGINVADLAGHVKDTYSFHFPWGHWEIPQVLQTFGISKYVLLEFGAAAVMFAVFIPFARHICGGKQAKGRFWNMLEVFLVYLKDDVIIPSIGSAKEAAPYIPYLWTLFFFVLFCNLAGMLPWMGSPTGSAVVTGVLALITLTVVIAAGIKQHGAVGFWKGMVPHIEGKIAGIDIAKILGPFMFVLEVFSFFVKHVTLCIRLMANMFGGHLMLAIFAAFIPMSAWAIYVWIPITVCAILASVAVSFLELFVAFLQAYIFTFLTSVYIGISIHQH
ncbi:MAG: F0F1 ATP synthase subunit A [Planctomycetaceae bacterium]|jgi:F-type H+-transporting ATPase subunit a|nr:F0F1 ATP synthase subunit A [Planctomycetaceae bacterium]